jgi:parallel beta-helix repeat protein
MGLDVETQSRGNILYVGGSGSGNYTRIQDAIDDASDGDTVYVFNDSSPYYENIRIYTKIDLIGEDKNTTIIHGGSSGHTSVIIVYADGVKITGFTVQHSGTDERYDTVSNQSNYSAMYSTNNKGIALDSSNNIVIGNIVQYNWNAITLWKCENNLILNNIISSNDDGIVMSHSSNNLIMNNTICSNDQKGIHMYRGGNNTIEDNDISNNGDEYWYGCGIEAYHTNNNTIVNNNIRGNINTGIDFHNATHNNISRNCISNSDLGLFISSSKNNLFSLNMISSNFEGINVWGPWKVTPLFNTFNKNNLIDNNLDVFLVNSFLDFFTMNYWKRPRVLPKVIIGIVVIGLIPIPFINVDLRPAQEPYEIGV